MSHATHDLSERVLSLLAATKHIPRERISLNSSLEELGVDSLDKVTLLFEIEKRFDITVSDEDAAAVRTVSDIVERVAGALAASPPHPAAAEPH